MEELEQVNGGLGFKKSFCFSHWDRYLGMMTAMTQVPVLVLDLRLTIRTRPLL